ncbi:hypothetical protein E2C01_005989 [Portunus trituberculatus]|uniref:Uncharacterized protein n=1 Tax=Portunus trituberculatus TaxID=210409 RepID=A0A5B7D0L0_PORTR|nr:hypothetical protein [Portunus trituberculatus]
MCVIHLGRLLVTQPVFPITERAQSSYTDLQSADRGKTEHSASVVMSQEEATADAAANNILRVENSTGFMGMNKTCSHCYNKMMQEGLQRSNNEIP